MQSTKGVGRGTPREEGSEADAVQYSIQHIDRVELGGFAEI